MLHACPPCHTASLTGQDGKQVLPEALEVLEAAVLGLADAEVAARACSCIEEVLAGSDDYTRKTLFVRWYMRMAAMCASMPDHVRT